MYLHDALKWEYTIYLLVPFPGDSAAPETPPEWSFFSDISMYKYKLHFYLSHYPDIELASTYEKNFGNFTT